MLTVVQLTLDTPARPTQWEGILDDSRSIYVWYRHGRLMIGVGVTLDEAVDHADTDTAVFNGLVPSPEYGCLSYEALQEATKGLVHWPSVLT